MPTAPISAREANWEKYGQRRAATLRMPKSARERHAMLPTPPSQYTSVFSRRSRFALPRSGQTTGPSIFPSLSKFDPDSSTEPANDEMVATAASERLMRSSMRQPAREPKRFCVEEYRKKKARREGLNEMGDSYWKGEMGKKRQERLEDDMVRDQHWKQNVQPWLTEKAKPRPSTSQRRLKASRRELRDLRAQMEESRKVLERDAKALLKDVTFLLDHLKPGAKRSNKAQDNKQKEKHDANSDLLADFRNIVMGEKLTKHKLGEIEDFHRTMVHSLFMDADADGSGELERDEIKMLARMMGAKLSKVELDYAMSDMDSDGSGEVDFKEFYGWWTQKGKESTLVKKDGNSYSRFFDVVPHAEM